jgi:hypothetical protein
MPHDVPEIHHPWSSSIREAAAFLLELEEANLLPEELNDDARRL